MKSLAVREQLPLWKIQVWCSFQVIVFSKRLENMLYQASVLLFTLPEQWMRRNWIHKTTLWTNFTLLWIIVEKFIPYYNRKNIMDIYLWNKAKWTDLMLDSCSCNSLWTMECWCIFNLSSSVSLNCSALVTLSFWKIVAFPQKHSWHHVMLWFQY